MSALLDMLIPAVVLSGTAIACCVLLPRLEPRVGFAIAIGGLAAWIVPWPWIELPFVTTASPVASWIAAYAPELAASLDQVATDGRLVEHRSAYFVILTVALFVPGLAWFLRDCLLLRASLREWRARSRCGESLRELLPRDLRRTRAQIRIVPGTRVAAATGWIDATIWIGDRFASDDALRLALLHECWHIRRRDPVWLALIVAVKRAYWWNPIVAYLSRRALLMMESACDYRCVEVLGRRPYLENLAGMMLDTKSSDWSRLVAAASGQSLNVQRLRLLDSTLRLRARDCALIALLFAAATFVTGSRVSASPTARPAWSHVDIPATPAGKALAALLEAFNDDDTGLLDLYLGVYTPQEVSLRPYGWDDTLELLDIVSSERLSIEYRVRSNHRESEHIGRLEVADADSVVVTRSEFRSVPVHLEAGSR